MEDGEQRRDERGAVDIGVIRETSLGDTHFERELIRIFLADNDERVARIGAAIRTGDAARVWSDAHALKGASGTIGATRLTLLARQLEVMGARGELSGGAARYKDLVGEYARVRDALEEHVRSLSEPS